MFEEEDTQPSITVRKRPPPTTVPSPITRPVIHLEGHLIRRVLWVLTAVVALGFATLIIKTC